MLSKEVCKKCYYKHAAPQDYSWGRAEEDYWQIQGRVDCPPTRLWESVFVLKSPPEWCPYSFEHAITAGMSNEK